MVGLLGLSAAANALGQLSSNSALARHVPAHRQGLSFGVKQAAIPVSTLLAGAAVPTIALTAGWRWAFGAAAGAARAALAAIPAQQPGPVRRDTARRAGRATAALVVIGWPRLARGGGERARHLRGRLSVGRGLDPGLAGLTLTWQRLRRARWGRLARRRRTGGPRRGDRRHAGGRAVGLDCRRGRPGAAGRGRGAGFGLGWAWPG
jgi:MFS family permease